MTVVTNEKGAKHAKMEHRLDLIPQQVLLSLGGCLDYGAKAYGDDNWKGISEQGNINHALVHLVMHLAGDASEPHLINAIARCFFAAYHAQERGFLPYGYVNNSQAEDTLTLSPTIKDSNFGQLIDKFGNCKICYLPPSLCSCTSGGGGHEES